jgi:hypothetical protein
MGLSCCVHLVKKERWLLDDDDDDAQIRKKMTFKKHFIKVLSSAVRQIDRMWISQYISG